MSKENELLATFTRFMLEHDIECEEDLYQNDDIDRDAFELIEDLFNIVKSNNVGKDNKQTNADRIRNMSDEELARFIIDTDFVCADYCDDYALGCGLICDKENKEVVLKWLKSKADTEE
jgi:hypothetical protein